MPDFFADIQSLDSALKEGWIILTPNHRSSVQVREIYGSHLKAQSDIKVTSSPAIYPIDIWLKNFFQLLVLDDDNLEVRTILESDQELSLWKKIIRESDISAPLLSLENAAPNVLEAYRLITQWQVSLSSLKAYQNKIDTIEYLDDSTAFIHWAELYQKFCKHNKLISFSELFQTILTHLKSNTFDLPEKIILLGFKNPPPLYQDFFEMLQDKISLQKLQWEEMQPIVKKLSFSNEIVEIKATAKWSQNILKNSPHAKIGIISSNIHNQQSLFRNVFQSTFKSTDEQSTPYFIASTKNFSKDYPLLLEILELFNFNYGTLSSLDLCHLLRSPLLLAQNEASARASLEFHLRNNGQMQVRSSQIRALLAKTERDWHSPLLAEALQNCETLRRHQKPKQKIFAWANFFGKQLHFLAWPSEELRFKNSFLIYCWQQILVEFKKLSFLYQALSFSQALAVLKPLIQNFQYNENRQEAPIQIYSPNEATGLRFTHLWILGLTDLQWPIYKYSNPFIPRALQRKLKLPDSSPELIHEKAINILSELTTNTAKNVVLSYPRTNDTGELLPTTLITLISPKTNIEDKDTTEISLQVHPQTLESFLNISKTENIELLEENPSIKILNIEILKGGISLISNQSECPFRAFAVHRLKSHELPKFVYGIPPKDIGTMLHLVLEHFWKDMKTQKAMKNTSSSSLTEMVNAACEIGIEYLRKKHSHLLQPNYAHIEKQRLSRLMKKWLEQENLRSAFEVVEQEYKLQWQYEELRLNFKIDRIDKLNNSFALIDYKSGSTKSEISDELRPSNPQLMLYASALAQENKFNPINALLYAQVNIDSPSYRGVSLDNEIYPKTGLNQQNKLIGNHSWDGLKQHWQSVLSNIAQEFLDGYIAVDPKTKKSCQYCHLSSFCRIKEKSQESIITSDD